MLVVAASSTAGLSHEQLLAACLARAGASDRATLGAPLRARQRSALRHLAEHQAAGRSFDAACQGYCRCRTRVSFHSALAAQQFTATGVLPFCPPRIAVVATLASTAHAGRASLDAELLIHRRLEAVKERNLYESSTTLRASLRFELGIDVSQRTMLRWLHELGYVYGPKRFVGAVKPACRLARMRASSASMLRHCAHSRTARLSWWTWTSPTC